MAKQTEELSGKKYWDDEHERLIKESGGTELTYSKEVLNAVLEVLDYKVRDKRVVEFGSGTGSNIVALGRLGVGECHAVDFSDSAGEHLRLLNSSQKTDIIFHKKNILKTGLKDDYFDIVLSEGLMEHFRFKKIGKYIKEQIRVTKPGGYIIIDVPQTFHLYTVKKQFLMLFGRWFAGWETQWSVANVKDIEAQFPELRIVKIFNWGSDRFPIIEKIGRLSPWLSQHIGVVYQKMK
jgi:ubiquinone/menaquinone biosynthesis C-methylase UbiE